MNQVFGPWFIVAFLGTIVLAAAAVKGIPVLWHGVQAAAKVPTILDRVAAEFGTNGGGSLRDGLNDLTATANATKEAVDSQRSALEQHLTQDASFQSATNDEFRSTRQEVQKMWLLLTLPREEREEFAQMLLRKRADDPPIE